MIFNNLKHSLATGIFLHSNGKGKIKAEILTQKENHRGQCWCQKFYFFAFLLKLLVILFRLCGFLVFLCLQQLDLFCSDQIKEVSTKIKSKSKTIFIKL